MADYDTFGRGGSVYPLTASTTNTLLQDSDPFIYYALDFFANQITTYLGSRLVAECARTPAISEITAAVAYTLPIDPAPYLQEEQIKFPLLAVYRKTADLRFRTNIWREDDCTCGVVYALPPLTGAQAERIQPILRSVVAVLDHQCEQGWRSNYTPPGGSAGQNVWSLAGIDRVEFRGAARYGAFEAADGLYMPAVTLDLHVEERVMPVTGAFSDMAGVDLDEQVHDQATDTTLDAVVQVKTDL